ncbi:MAG: glycoside hydrolase family 88 protein [Prolixibacteraceae bacterium]
MKKSVILIYVLAIALVSCQPKQEPMGQLIDRSLETAVVHAKAMAVALSEKEGRLPRSINPETGELITSGSEWWCSGFFPGTLWYLYEHTGDEEMKDMAALYTARIEKEKFNTGTHDLGFMLYCSFGNGLRLTGNDSYPEVLETGSRSLVTRYDSVVGLIRSWDSNKDKWQYPVIIDNMMNLEMLMWAFKHTGDSVFYRIAVSHADKTIANHFREDNSSYHVVSYDTLTGTPQMKQTHQGASDSSVWSRGQAWGLYGYSMMYRETGKKEYLDQAKKIAGLMIDHPNFPADGIPYWDYLAPQIPDEPRDASAAAVMASALIELSACVGDELKNKYLQVAETQLRTMASPAYLAEPGTNGNFVLMHSVGSKPHNSEVDVPLSYADYYFIEALLRYKELR